MKAHDKAASVRTRRKFIIPHSSANRVPARSEGRRNVDHHDTATRASIIRAYCHATIVPLPPQHDSDPRASSLRGGGATLVRRVLSEFAEPGGRERTEM